MPIISQPSTKTNKPTQDKNMVHSTKTYQQTISAFNYFRSILLSQFAGQPSLLCHELDMLRDEREPTVTSYANQWLYVHTISICLCKSSIWESVNIVTSGSCLTSDGFVPSTDINASAVMFKQRPNSDTKAKNKHESENIWTNSSPYANTNAQHNKHNESIATHHAKNELN